MTSSTTPAPSIFTKLSPTLQIVLSNTCGLLITYPGILISPTRIAESCTCLRRGVLSDKIRNFGISAPSAIMGNVRHAFMESLSEIALTILTQSAPQSKKWSDRYLLDQITRGKG